VWCSLNAEVVDHRYGGVECVGGGERVSEVSVSEVSVSEVSVSEVSVSEVSVSEVSVSEVSRGWSLQMDHRQRIRQA
jgi:hypothetical protein